MNTARNCSVLVGLLMASQFALATAADWHWDSFGTSNYGGQVMLKDDQGSAVNFQRYGAGSSAGLFADVSVQSPLLVVAGSDVKRDIVQSGSIVTKPTCTAPQVAKIYVTPVTICNFGQGNAIAGINAWSEQTATTFTPHVSAWFQGRGWVALDGTDCGRAKIEMMCE